MTTVHTLACPQLESCMEQVQKNENTHSKYRYVARKKMFKSSNYRSLDKEWTNLFVTGVLLALQSIQDLRPENAMIKIYTVYIIFQKWTILKIFIPFQALFESPNHPTRIKITYPVMFSNIRFLSNYRIVSNRSMSCLVTCLSWKHQ